jgi:hypothetical protein
VAGAAGDAGGGVGADAGVAVGVAAEGLLAFTSRAAACTISSLHAAQIFSV